MKRKMLFSFIAVVFVQLLSWTSESSDSKALGDTNVAQILWEESRAEYVHSYLFAAQEAEIYSRIDEYYELDSKSFKARQIKKHIEILVGYWFDKEIAPQVNYYCNTEPYEEVYDVPIESELFDTSSANIVLRSGMKLRKHPQYGVYMFHLGLDLTPDVCKVDIYATVDLKIVSRSGTKCGRGGFFIEAECINYPGFVYKFCHLRPDWYYRSLNAGDTIYKNQHLATVGNSGDVRCHLHVELEKDGEKVDISPVLDLLSFKASAEYCVFRKSVKGPWLEACPVIETHEKLMIWTFNDQIDHRALSLDFEKDDLHSSFEDLVCE